MDGHDDIEQLRSKVDSLVARVEVLADDNERNYDRLSGLATEIQTVHRPFRKRAMPAVIFLFVFTLGIMIGLLSAKQYWLYITP